MKIFAIALTVFVIAAFTAIGLSIRPKPDKPVATVRAKPDTVFVPAAIPERVLPDSISDKLYLQGYKLTRIRYYVKLCRKNPKLKKFFYGWVVRVVAER